jgi:hypothetical protein
MEQFFKPNFQARTSNAEDKKVEDNPENKKDLISQEIELEPEPFASSGSKSTQRIEFAATQRKSACTD